MPPRKVCDAPYIATYNQDDIARDEALAYMTARIYIFSALIAQMDELLIECHRTPEHEEKSSEHLTNQFSGR